MITNHGFVHVFHIRVFSRLIQLTQAKRWKVGFRLLKRFIKKLVLFVCLESLLASSILFGTGYVFVLIN